MQEAPDQAGDIRSLRLLQRLVTVLMVVMIAGFIVLIAFLVTRFPTGSDPLPFPDSIALPENATATAITRGDGWVAVVTDDQRILVYGDDGALRQTVEIAP